VIFGAGWWGWNMGLAKNKKIIIIASPNGAGKTTFAREFLPNEAACPVFINADLIAAGLAPFESESAAFKAGRLMLSEMQGYARKGENFAFETTLSGHAYARLIPHWQRAGYRQSASKSQGGGPQYSHSGDTSTL